MKKLIFFIIVTALVLGCKDKPKPEENTAPKNDLFERDFRDYTELDALEGYEKQIDTVVHMGGSQDNYRLMNLRKKENYLVLFYKVTEWDEQEIHHTGYRAIDTIEVRNLRNNERVTVGYCRYEDFYEGEVIALVRGTNKTEELEIIKAWRANPETEEIRVLEDMEGIQCINEFFEEENATIPLEKIS